MTINRSSTPDSIHRISTPVKSRLPGPSRVAGSPRGVTASPQVRARLAELRKATKQASVPSPSTDDGSKDAPDDENSKETTISRSGHQSFRSESSKENGSRAPSRSSQYEAAPELPAFGDVPVDFAIQNIGELVEKAKTSGRLNISSHELTQIPDQVYHQLIPRGSPYHPAATAPPNTSADGIQRAFIDLSISSADRDDHGDSEEGPRWWEIADLTVLKASNNEIAHVDDNLAGFESMEVLDLHSNKISSLPASFGTLVNLTALNLSKNHLKEFPLELMALIHLKELDLSSNGLAGLWSRDWRDGLKSRLKEVSKKRRKMLVNPDASFESVSSQNTSPDKSGSHDFWSAFPTSPVKPREPAYSRTHINIDYAKPLPSLVKFDLHDNNLRASALSSHNLLQLPPLLSHLDLSGNGLSGPIPYSTFATLSDLKTLDLANNGLDDEFFSGPIDEEDGFPSLIRLNLQYNAIDSLEHLEANLCIGHLRQVNYTGIASSTLRRYLSPTQDEHQSLALPPLTVDLKDNFLREELPRRRGRKNPPQAAAASSNDDAVALKKQAERLVVDVNLFVEHMATRLNSKDFQLAELDRLTQAVLPIQEYLKTVQSKENVSSPHTVDGISPEQQLNARRKQHAEYVWAPL